MKSLFEEMGGTYRQVGDYLIPNLTLPAEEREIRLGKWGKIHKDYLKNLKRLMFDIMLTKGTLFRYLAEIDKQAQEMFDRLMEQMAKAEDVTEQLKEENQMLWVARMNNIRNRAEEIVLYEIIYTV